MGPGPQSFAKACNQGRSNYLAEQLPLGPKAIYQAVMSPQIICLPAPEPRLAAGRPPDICLPAYQRPLCPGESIWNQIVADEPESRTASGLCKHSPQTKRDWSDMGVGDGGTPAGISKPHSLNHWDSTPLAFLYLLPRFIQVLRHRVPPPRGPLFPFPLPLSSLGPLPYASAPLEAFQSAILLILFPSCLPAAGPSLVTLLPWLLNLLNPALRGSSPGSITLLADSLAKIT